MVIKLRHEGRGPDADHVSLVGTVSRDGQTVASGRIGAWWGRDEFNRVNAAVLRGRTAPSPRFEMLHADVRPDGTYAIEGLKLNPGNPGRWFLALEEPGHAPTVLGPLTLKAGGQRQTIPLAAVAGGSVSGKVEHIPEALAGQVWVVAFNQNIIRREIRVGRDGSFRLDGLPPGRYGLKVGHDGYRDPHIPQLGPLTKKRTPEDLAQFKKKAEPWQGAVVAAVRPGATTPGLVLDFRPPGPVREP